MVQHMGEEGTYAASVVQTPSHQGYSSAVPPTSAVPPSSAGPSTSATPSAHSHPTFEPHKCTSCGHPCYGLSRDVAFSGFLSDVCRWLILIIYSIIFLFVHIYIV